MLHLDLHAGTAELDGGALMQGIPPLYREINDRHVDRADDSKQRSSTIGAANIAASQLVGYVLVLCRVGALFTLAPIFSARMIPMQAKLVVAGAVSFALMPLVTSGVTVPTDVTVAVVPSAPASSSG